MQRSIIHHPHAYNPQPIINCMTKKDMQIDGQFFPLQVPQTDMNEPGGIGMMARPVPGAIKQTVSSHQTCQAVSHKYLPTDPQLTSQVNPTNQNHPRLHNKKKNQLMGCKLSVGASRNKEIDDVLRMEKLASRNEVRGTNASPQPFTLSDCILSMIQDSQRAIASSLLKAKKLQKKTNKGKDILSRGFDNHSKPL